MSHLRSLYLITRGRQHGAQPSHPARTGRGAEFIRATARAGDRANLQYRINGIIVPESISGFGQTLDTRFIDSLKFLTGALPAQYGYRTAGVVDITTKSGAQLGNGGSVGLYGGSFGTFNPSVELQRSSTNCSCASIRTTARSTRSNRCFHSSNWPMSKPTG